MEPPPTRADVAADDGSWFGLGEMSERECWGRDEGEGYFGLKGCLWLMLIEICLGG